MWGPCVSACVVMSVWALLGVVLRENWYMDYVMVDGCEVEIDDVETAWTMSERDRWGKTGHERSSGLSWGQPERSCSGHCTRRCRVFSQ